MHVDLLGQVCKAHHRIRGPIDAPYPALVECHRFEQRPAQGLHNAAFDLVADAVRIHCLAAVDSRHYAYDADLAVALDLDLERDRAVGRGILVTRESKAAAAR